MIEQISETLRGARLHDAVLAGIEKKGGVVVVKFRLVNPEISRSLRITGVKTMKALLDGGEIIFDAECHPVPEDNHSRKDPDSLSFYSTRGDWILEFSCSTRGSLSLLLDSQAKMTLEETD